MSFSDIFKKSFLTSMNTGDLSIKFIVLVLVITSVLATYIFFAYRFFTRKTFYNKSFGVSLAIIALIVASIIMTIQSNIVISLGMVGALSIVRFRTAIKEPMDLAFLFWSISVGIICGAGLFGIAVVGSLLITLGIIIFNALPIAKAPLLLIVNSNNEDDKEMIMKAVETNVKHYNIKSQTIKNEQLALVIEVRVKDSDALIKSVSAIEGVTQCSLLCHDGEVTF